MAGSVDNRRMVRVPIDRMPKHPGEILKEEFLILMGSMRRELACVGYFTHSFDFRQKIDAKRV